MHIKDHNDAMTFFRNSKQLESNGKWKEFVDEMEFDSMLQESPTMAQEPRIGLQGGQLVQNTVDGSRPGYQGSKPILSRDKFVELRIKYKNTHTNTEFAELLNKDWKPRSGDFLIKIMLLKE